MNESLVVRDLKRVIGNKNNVFVYDEEYKSRIMNKYFESTENKIAIFLRIEEIDCCPICKSNEIEIKIFPVYDYSVWNGLWSNKWESIRHYLKEILDISENSIVKIAKEKKKSLLQIIVLPKLTITILKKFL